MRAVVTILVLGTVLALATACGQQVAGEPKAAQNLAANRPSVKPTTVRTTRPSTTKRSPTTSTRPSDRPDNTDRLAGLVGTWEGQYTCGQGNTGLRLIIKEPKEKTLPTVFEFFPLPDNPSAKEGSYAMVGSFAPSGQLVLKQQQWINQPPGYMMVDLAVTSPLEGDTEVLSGDVLDQSCKGFSVRRR